MDLRISFEQAKFHKSWTCEVINCGRWVRMYRKRHHCRMCGLTICKSHTVENVTIISTVHQVGINYNKICFDCFDKGRKSDDGHQDKDTTTQKTMTIDSNLSDACFSNFPLQSPSGVDEIENIHNSVATPLLSRVTINHANDALEEKDNRIKELESQVLSQASELKSISNMVERKLSGLQAQITSKNNLIQDLQSINTDHETTLTAKRLEVTELQRQLAAVLRECTEYSLNVSAAREENVRLENQLSETAVACRAAHLSEQRLRGEVQLIRDEFSKLQKKHKTTRSVSISCTVESTQLVTVRSAADDHFSDEDEVESGEEEQGAEEEQEEQQRTFFGLITQLSL